MGLRKAILGSTLGIAGLAIAGASNDHEKAREFTDTYQDPFGADVAGIVDPITKAREAGTLTYEEVQKAQDALEERISRFKFDSDAYSIRGGDQMKVVEQSRTTLDPIIEGWRSALKADADKLKPSTELAPIPTMASLLARHGQTPTGQAQGAANRLRRRALAVSSILTGYKGTTGTTTRKTAAVGY